MRKSLSYLPGYKWLNRRWNSWSLTKKLVLFYLPLFVLPSIVGLSLLAQNYNAAIRTNAESYSDSITSLTVDKLEATIETYNNVSLHILTSDEIGAILSEPIHNEFEKIELQQQLERSVLPIIGGLDSNRIKGCVFMTDNTTFIIGQDEQEPLSEKGKSNTVTANGAPYWDSVRSGYTTDNDVSAFRLGRVIKDDNFRPIGYFYLIVSSNVLRDVLSSAMAGSNTAFFLNGPDRVLLQEQVIQEDTFSEVLRLEQSIDYNEWTLTAEYALNTVYATVYRMSVFAAWLAGGSLVLGLAASYLIRTDIALPIARLLANMRRGLRGEKPNSLTKFRGAREITQLNETFISVMYEIYNLLGEVKASEERKRQVQLKVLQNQLSPHFIYNTLNTIRWMAMIRKQDHIKEIVDALSNLLRYSIRDTNELVSLENEINVMREFVKIQQVRHQNFIFQVELEDEVKPYRLLKFLIQPLLENAIVHGLSSIDHSGQIRLEAKAEKGMLSIRVWDNGSGIDQERLSEIQQVMSSGTGSHIGLLSVKERIEMFYGPAYGMNITSERGAGTTVELKLPILKEGWPNEND
ncbi:sensor histidine kinase [Paenibacillus sp. FSL R7-0652]|uniref:sensor histidine kinase n=1 Tax=Paenibacillus sp. FSL R7-0652 TaxID=2921687 RepID=UPI00315A4E41